MEEGSSVEFVSSVKSVPFSSWNSEAVLPGGFYRDRLKREQARHRQRQNKPEDEEER